MSYYSSASPANDATFNSLHGFEAQVIQGVATSGTTYGSISTALAAGHRSIYVHEGNYAEAVSITNTRTRIVCARPTAPSAGVLVSSLTINADYVHVKGLTVYQGGGNGCTMYGGSSYVLVEDCSFRECQNHGMQLCYNTVQQTINVYIRNCTIYDNGQSGVGDGIAFVEPGDMEVRATIEGCFIYSNDDDGINALRSSATSVNHREITLLNNQIWANGLYGFRTGPNSSVHADGNHVSTNGSGGCYISNPAAANARSRIIGNRFRSNGAYGVQLAASSDKIVVMGNQSEGHSSSNYYNCGSSPGYAVVNTNVSG